MHKYPKEIVGEYSDKSPVLANKMLKSKMLSRSETKITAFGTRAPR